MDSREFIRQTRKNVIDSERYCEEGYLSSDNFDNINNLKKKELKKVASLIEDFIDNLLDMACNMEKEIITGRKRKVTGLKCKIPYHFENDDQWPKRFIPQMYHILQDYGLFFIYLKINPQYRSTNILGKLVSATISQQRTCITGKDDMETHTLRVNFLNKLNIRLQKIKFLRDLYTNCCSTTTKSSGKSNFDFVILGIEGDIEANRYIEEKALENITKPSDSDSDSDSDS